MYALRNDWEMYLKDGYIRTRDVLSCKITNLIIDRLQALGAVNYVNIDEIAEDFFEHPERNQEVMSLRRATSFTAEDVIRTSRLAFIEFYTRVGRLYAHQRSHLKGFVDPYRDREILWPNEAMTKFGEKKPSDQSSQTA